VQTKFSLLFLRLKPEHDISIVNDPSAGSPTDTVLRLDQTTEDWVYKTSQAEIISNNSSIRIIHRIIQSIDATGGVYKGQGRNQHKIMTYAY
jgi:hypothetical protein